MLFKNWFSSLVLCLHVCVFPGYTELCCPDGWIFFQNSCYIFEDEVSLNWAEASHLCSSHHQSSIVVIDSKEENLMLINQANKLYKPGADRSTWFWIGATDDEIEGLWKWYTNSKSLSGGFTDWYPGQPNDYLGHEDCACLFGPNPYRFHWGDFSCESKSHVICERNLTSLEIPAVVG